MWNIPEEKEIPLTHISIGRAVSFLFFTLIHILWTNFHCHRCHCYAVVYFIPIHSTINDFHMFDCYCLFCNYCIVYKIYWNNLNYNCSTIDEWTCMINLYSCTSNMNYIYIYISILMWLVVCTFFDFFFFFKIIISCGGELVWIHSFISMLWSSKNYLTTYCLVCAPVILIFHFHLPIKFKIKRREKKTYVCNGNIENNKNTNRIFNT